MADSTVYYLSIPDITCGNCVNTIKAHLLAKGYVQNIDINILTKRCKVVVNKPTQPKQVIDDIKESGSKFANTKLLTDKRTVYFAVEGLNTQSESDHLRAIFNKLSFLLNSYQVNFSSKSIKLELIDDENKETLKHIFAAIQADTLLKHIALEPLSLQEDKENNQSTFKHYFNNAWINLGIGAPIWIISMMGWIPTPLTLPGQLVGLGLGSLTMIIMYVTGKEFYKDAFTQFLKNRSYNMNTLISLGTGSAWLYSMLLVAFPTFFPFAVLHYQFLAVNMILGIINLGKGIRERLQEKTRAKVKSIEDMFIDLQPQQANRLKLKFSPKILVSDLSNAQTENISYKKLRKHDIMEIKPGERVPVEGVVIGVKDDDKSTLDQSTLTGEAKPCVIRKGSSVHSGSLNRGATVYVCATRNGNEGNLTKLIEDAKRHGNSNETSISSTIDKVAKIFVPTIITLAILSGLGWFLWGPAPQLAYMIKSALAVTLCACPCALGLATPISTMISIFKLFKKGILVHQATVIEKVAQLDAIVFDKTGTLTEPTVKEVFTSGSGWLDKQVLKYFASIEQGSSHPIAHALEDTLQDTLKLVSVEQLDNGLEGVLETETKEHVKVIVGNYAQLDNKKIVINNGFRDKETEWEKNGYTILYIAVATPREASKLEVAGYTPDYHCVGMIALEHNIRPDAKTTIEALRKQNIDLYVLSGDNEASTNLVAAQLGIKKVFAERRPDQKAAYIAQIRKNKRIVAMVGDGANDIEAINKADVGIAVGPWTHASTRSKVTVQSLSDLTTLLTISKQAMSNIHQNLLWTGFYNVFSLIAASGLLYPFFGFVLNPVLASITMAFSSIFVVFNSSRLSYLIDNAIHQQEGKVEPKGLAGLLRAWLQPHQAVKNLKNTLNLGSHEDDEDVIYVGQKRGHLRFTRPVIVKQESVEPQEDAVEKLLPTLSPKKPGLNAIRIKQEGC
ncbi:MAG: heavy metal translocating P-type ATPase [Candidatus Berkiella sp.]